MAFVIIVPERTLAEVAVLDDDRGNVHVLARPPRF